MGDQTIYSNPETGESLHIRTHKYGEPGAEVRLVLHPGGDTPPVVTAVLSRVHLGILAHAFARAFFNETGRVAWPVSGPMLSVYEKEQAIAERDHLDWLRNSPAGGELHLVFEEQAMRRRLKDLETLRVAREHDEAHRDQIEPPLSFADDETGDVQRQAERPDPALDAPALDAPAERAQEPPPPSEPEAPRSRRRVV